jgi:mRNA-degrading endonuclease RelE of RelBE toxin-antitoxin system
MSYNVLRTTEFEKELKQLSKKYASLKSEYGDLVDSLSISPDQGTSLGNNCYKIRLAIASKGRGKSAGARVITCVYLADEEVVLVSIYDKSEQSTITDKVIQDRLKRFRK